MNIPGYYYDPVKKRYFKRQGQPQASPAIELGRPAPKKEAPETRREKITQLADVQIFRPEIMYELLVSPKCVSTGQFLQLQEFLHNEKLASSDFDRETALSLYTKTQMQCLLFRQIARPPLDLGQFVWASECRGTLFVATRLYLVAVSVKSLELAENSFWVPKHNVPKPQEAVLQIQSIGHYSTIALGWNINVVDGDPIKIRVSNHRGIEEVEFEDTFKNFRHLQDTRNVTCMKWMDSETGIVGFERKLRGHGRLSWLHKNISSLPVSIAFTLYENHLMVAIGYMNGALEIYREKDECIHHAYGASIRKVQFLHVDSRLYLLVSGLANKLVLFAVDNDPQQLFPLLEYKEYEHSFSTQENFYVHRSQQFFVVYTDKNKKIKVYSIFNARPLREFDHLPLAGGGDRFLFVGDSLVSLQNGSLDIFS
ncbi:hypothetical protein KL949_004488 [Ogataea haglerorum]|nr:hypothetical protein KL913_004549 [Ogataea haglerorum]KAG7715095.1 hypothetical protein KL949_004488 [Ogataea haglerorum]KAG7745969.1 hypothetical protein KL912_004825 [Ogataea haglerorum]KAG7805269.1 hypothetical protein KL924_004986 [Ogataea haglerorum]